jgi:hypothetical protein
MGPRAPTRWNPWPQGCDGPRFSLLNTLHTRQGLGESSMTTPVGTAPSAWRSQHPGLSPPGPTRAPRSQFQESGAPFPSQDLCALRCPRLRPRVSLSANKTGERGLPVPPHGVPARTPAQLPIPRLVSPWRRRIRAAATSSQTLNQNEGRVVAQQLERSRMKSQRSTRYSARPVGLRRQSERVPSNALAWKNWLPRSSRHLVSLMPLNFAFRFLLAPPLELKLDEEGELFRSLLCYSAYK